MISPVNPDVELALRWEAEREAQRKQREWNARYLDTMYEEWERRRSDAEMHRRYPLVYEEGNHE